MAGRWEPGELRGSRRVLRAPEGETPSGDSPPGFGGGTRSPSAGSQAADGRVHGRADAVTLAPEKTAITHVDDGFDLLGLRIKRRPWRTGQVTSPTHSLATARSRDQAPHQAANRPQHDEPVARCSSSMRSTQSSGVGATTTAMSRRSAASVPQLLPVVASDPLAAQEVPATDLETDQTAVLGRKWTSRRHQAPRGPPRSR